MVIISAYTLLLSPSDGDYGSIVFRSVDSEARRFRSAMAVASTSPVGAPGAERSKGQAKYLATAANVPYTSPDLVSEQPKPEKSSARRYFAPGVFDATQPQPSSTEQEGPHNRMSFCAVAAEEKDTSGPTGGFLHGTLTWRCSKLEAFCGSCF